MRFLFVLLAPAVSGCYFLHLAEGQLRVLAGSRDIPEVLAHPNVTAEAKEKLLRVLEAREFGQREIGLAPSSNYTRFFDTGGEPVSWVVSACRKDRFEPRTWWFPIVGTVPYKGFFRKEDAEVEARALEGEGYDVSLAPVSAYSTLGWFADPVFSPMLDLPEEELIALILHELTHGTVWIAGDADFNESLAEFCGRQGALEFMRWRFGSDSAAYDRAVNTFARAESRDARLREAHRRLDDLYRSGAPAERKLELRDLVAGFAVNNAEILARRRYGNYDGVRALFERVGGNWRRFFELARLSDSGGKPLSLKPHRVP